MGKILLVEDNDNIRQLYERILFHHHIVSAIDGKQAFKALEGESFDLIILDMHLPGISGLEILRRIRVCPPYMHTPVFAISSDDSYRFAAQDLGIQCWMTKPIELEHFIQVVQSFLPQNLTAC